MIHPLFKSRALYDRFRRDGGDRPDTSGRPKAVLVDHELGLSVSRVSLHSHATTHLCDRDREIGENLAFEVPIFTPNAGVHDDSRLVVVLHGLNESLYNKLFPWAASLCASLGRAVALFPMALHMTRRPHRWIELGRELYPIRQAMPGNGHTSPFNAVLSQRFHERPDRFVRGGLQTMDDLGELAAHASAGTIAGLREGAVLDFLGYSAGGYVALTMLADAAARDDARFAHSRVVLFASGADVWGVHTESLLILDRLSSQALRAFHAQEAPARAALDRQDRRVSTFSRLFAGGPSLAPLLTPLQSRVVAVFCDGDATMDPTSAARNLSPLRGTVIEAGPHEYPFSLTQPVPDVYSAGSGRRLLGSIASSSDVAPELEAAFTRFITLTAQALA